MVLIQPEKRSRRKTDQRDANELSQTVWVNREQLLGGKRIHGLRRIAPPSKEDEENRQLTALRKRMTSARTRTINQVQHILLKHNLLQECPTKRLQMRESRCWLAELTLDEIDQLQMDQLLAQWTLSGQLALVYQVGDALHLRDHPVYRDWCHPRVVTKVHTHHDGLLRKYLAALAYVLVHVLDVLRLPDPQTSSPRGARG